MRLLIVDDEVESLEWLEEMFIRVKEEEISVYTAASGKAAIEILNNVKCDVVLTDIQMPGMNGMELYQHVKENWPRAKVVFLTGYSTHDILYQAVQNKEIRYLMKTESPEKIVATVLDAYKELKKELETCLLQEKQEERLSRAQYWFQKEWLEYLIFAGEGRKEPEQKEFDELELQLGADCPIYVFLGRIESKEKALTVGRQEKILFAVRENMPGIVRAYPYILEGEYLLGLIQPKLQKECADWNRIFYICAEALEDVLHLCEECSCVIK